MYDDSGLYLLQQSLEIGSHVKMLVRKVLGVERYMKFYEVYPPETSYIFLLLGTGIFLVLFYMN